MSLNNHKTPEMQPIYAIWSTLLNHKGHLSRARLQKLHLSLTITHLNLSFFFTSSGLTGCNMTFVVLLPAGGTPVWPFDQS